MSCPHVFEYVPESEKAWWTEQDLKFVAEQLVAANAAVTLLRLGEREKVLPVFDMTDAPEALTQFIFRCRPVV